MFEFVTGLFDTTGFVPRSQCGAWTASLTWIHVGSDLFIWLAYLSIPLVLFYFTRRRDLPYPRLFLLFALFILACGFGHLIEALMFKYPLYRLAAAVKILTAVVSWATVLALIPVIPRVMEAVSAPQPQGNRNRPGDTTLHDLAIPLPRGRINDYVVAILAGVLALLIRAAIEPLVEHDHVFVLSLLAVVFVSWRSGFGPGIVTLLVSMVGMVYLFIPQKYSLVIEGFGHQLATGMFFFCGVCCAALGEAQFAAQRRSKEALSVALERKAELEVEVSRRREVERALRQRESDLIELNRKVGLAQEQTVAALAQLEALVQNAPVGIAFLDNDLQIIRVNRFIAQVKQQSNATDSGRLTEKVSFLPKLANECEQVLDSGKPLLEQRLTTQRNGASGGIWSVSVFPVAGLDGRRLGLGVIGQNVTERERVSDALRESEERFRSMADSVPSLIWLTDLDQRRTYFNKTWLEFTGRSIEQELGDGWIDNVHPDYRDRYLNAYAAAFTACKPFELEYLLRRHDGEYRWVLARGTPRFTPSAEFAGFVGLCLDVTDRKRAEERQRASEARYRTLTEAIPQLVWNGSSSGDVTFFNQRWMEYTGLSLEQSRGRGWTAAVHPDDLERLRGRWQLAVAQQASSFASEFRLRRRDGAYRWMLSNAVSLRDPMGTQVEWVGSATDVDDQKRQSETLENMVRARTRELENEIEERKRIEQQVRAVATELARSNGELEQFAYVASHDLQEPLRKIQAFGDRLRNKFRDQLPELGKDYVDRMDVSAARMRRLIDDLLTFSRVTTHARPFTRINLEKLIKEVVSDLEERISQTDASVEIGKLPTIEGDPTQMRQLFQNLIANAIKFHRPEAAPRVTIDAEVSTDSQSMGAGEAIQTCRIFVRDNGIGFEEKYRERIFQVFQRLHARGEYEGTGVGLAICRKITERHGGTICAQSLPGEGATFVVTLPTRQPRERTSADGPIDQETHHDLDGG